VKSSVPNTAPAGGETSTLGRVRVVWNPSAGALPRLPAEHVDAAALRDLLARHGIAADVTESRSEAEGRAAVREAVADGCRTIVAAGGDGTFDLVAGELLGTDAAVGMLPLGRAMNVGRALNIPRELEQAAQILAAGHVRVIDVGVARGRVYYEVASIGLTAELLGLAHAFDKGRHGSIVDLFRALARFPRRLVRLRVDDREIETRALAIVVANGPYGGLGLTLAPDARLDDGKLDVRIFRRFSRLELVRHFWAIAFGRRAYVPQVTEFRAKRVVIETPGLPCRADAVDLGRTPLEITLRPGLLRVIAPPAR
jgi:diacylglycerol kinase (ATP)